LAGDPTFAWTDTLREEDVEFLQLSEDYLGAGYSIVGSRSFTVYLMPEQLAHR
jgi:hypothetical protein